jgi:triosephosphate isomerase
MRKKIVAGNWKMNTDLNEGILLSKEVNKFGTEHSFLHTGIILCPPFTHITEVIKNINSHKISVSAQNCSSEPKGAFTGEVSAAMLKSIGCSHCLVGHSERRTYFNEDNTTLNKKVMLLLQNNIIPIYCCGEVLKEREEGKLFDVIKQQITDGLFNLSETDFMKVIIAYEPVWAIGTGVVASPEQAQEMHAYIRDLIIQKYGIEVAQNTTILYGGSCNAANAKVLFSQQDIDGGLIGGASLKADDFCKIITSF